MILFIGLGNPGDEYKNNRHNVGFMVIDKLAQELGINNFEFDKYLKSYIAKGEIYLLAKPTTFMNSSGDAVNNIVTQYGVTLENLWVIHDDLDLHLGEYKIQFVTGPKIHKGLLSIYKKLGSKDFWHVRVGVDNREKNNRIPGETYILQNFNKEEIIERDRIIYEVVRQILKRVIK